MEDLNVLEYARVEAFMMCRERQGSQEVNVSMLVHSYPFVVEARFPSPLRLMCGNIIDTSSPAMGI